MTHLGDAVFLPGVPVDYVRERLEKADGHELTSGKLESDESSAALAVNTFGWFHDRTERLPPFLMLGSDISDPNLVEVEYCARFPWPGGRHPWLDAYAETSESIIGIESKRFEPYRGQKTGIFSDTYDRPVWHDRMVPFERMRDKIRSGAEKFEFLDAVQLVKHAFGLVTEGRRKTKRPYLVYLFAEPEVHVGKPIDVTKKRQHREEISRFAASITGAEVTFGSISYREWLADWPDTDLELISHRAAILGRFQP
jgi:hypothetical protein